MPSTAAMTRRGGRLLPVMAAMALASVVLVLYLPSLDFSFFILDDYDTVWSDPAVRQGLTSDSIRSALRIEERDVWIPATRMSFMADVEVHGFSAKGFRLTNVLLHAAGMALWLLLLWRMTGHLGASTAAAALVALHPMRVESVVWISERKDVLAAFFTLLALAAYLAFAARGRFRWYWYLASVTLFAVSLASKPLLVTFPILLLILDFWPLARIGGRHEDHRAFRWTSLRPVILEKVPYLILSAGAGILTLAMQRESLHPLTDPHPFLLRIQNLLFATFIYLRKTFWPVDLAIDVQLPVGGRLQPWLFALAAAVLVLITWVALQNARRRPFLAAGWLWYLAALFPASGIVPTGKQWIADRFMYVPHMGFAIVLAWGLADLASRRRWARRLLFAGAVATLAALALLTTRQIGYWVRSSVILERSVALAPDKADLRNMLASSLMEEGRFSEAEKQFRNSIMIDPRFATTRFNYGIALKNMGRLSDAVAQFAEAVRLDPKDELARLYLSAMEVEEARPDLAAALYADYLRRNPLSTSNALVQAYLGLALARAGDLAGAESNLRSAIVRNPDQADAHYNLAIILANEGRIGEAVSHYDEALRIWPKDLQARLNLAELLFSEGRFAEAEKHFTVVIGQVPGSAEACFSRGKILQMRGDDAGAEAEFQAGLSAPGTVQTRTAIQKAIRSVTVGRQEQGKKRTAGEDVGATFQAPGLSPP